MNPDTPKNPREKLEAKLTSLLLGELPHEEAAALHQKLAQDAESAKLYERLKHTVSVVRETLRTPAEQPANQPAPLKLSDERRQKLLQHFKTVAPQEFARPGRRWKPRLVEVGIAAALLALLGALLLPMAGSKHQLQTLSLGPWSMSQRDDASSADRLREVERSAQLKNIVKLADRGSVHGGPGSTAGAADETTRRVTPSQSVQLLVGGKPGGPSTVFQVPLPKSELATIALPQDLEHPASAPPASTPTREIDSFWDHASGLSRLAGGPGDHAKNAAAVEYSFTLNNGAIPSTKPSAGDVYNRGQLNFHELNQPGQDAASRGTFKLGWPSSPSGSPVGGLALAGEQQKPGQDAQKQTPFLGTYAWSDSTTSPATESLKLKDVDQLGKNEVAQGVEMPPTLEPNSPATVTVLPSQVPEPALAAETFRRQYGVASAQPPAEKPADVPGRSEAKTPVLGDLPSAGILFRSGSEPSAKRAEAESNPTLQAGRSVQTAGATEFGLASRTPAAPPTSLPPSPTANHFAGGAFGGYSSIQQSPDGGHAAGTGGSAIVLPLGQAASSGLREDESGKSVPLFAAANSAAQPAIVAAQTQEQDANTAANFSTYREAQTNLEELNRFRQVLDMKIAGEKIDVDLPKRSMVEIVDKAVPAAKDTSSLWEKLRGDTSGKFKSSARVKVERDQSDIAGLAERDKAVAYDPYFIQTEYEAIQSERILGKVATNLNLNKAWANKQAGKPLTTAETIERLKKSLDLRSVPNSSVVEIGAKSDNPEEAAKIANAVAEAYQADRREQRAKLTSDEVRASEERFKELDAKAREAQKKVDNLRAQLQIAEAAPSAGGTSARQSDSAPPKPAAPPPIPQPEIQTCDNSFSTFSLNVSDVSFKLAAASLEKGLMPEPATVRSEEFINAFDYRDPEPPAGVPVAFAYERARYPFAQNRDLLRFSLKTAALGRQPGRPLNIVLLLDNSGSMERADRVRIIQEALRVLAAQLQPQDKFSVVAFARTPRLWVDGVAGNEAAQAAAEVGTLTPQGGTNLEDAMNLAYQTALRHYLANGINRVVLLTDGAANLGNVDPEALKQKVEANRKQGIALDCFGIGWEGYNDDLLEVLSRNGDGRYGFINAPEEAATEFASQLAGALHVAASDVKVQVEFNPARVTAWRQIGYAKHQLTKEQFRDNTVDAAEIGAAESGNALYTVEVNPRGDGPLATVRVRYKVPGTTDYHEHEWPVPYNGNAVALEQASPALRLAATGSAFSEWLVSSPYAAEVSPDRLLGYLNGVPELYGADPRPKKLEWMIRQAKSITAK